MKDLVWKLRMYQKFAACLKSIPTDLGFLEFIGQFSHIVPGRKF